MAEKAQATLPTSQEIDCRPKGKPLAGAASQDLTNLIPADLHGRPLVIFDGDCVLCTGFARAVARLDRQNSFRFATAQSPLGSDLFRHFGLPTDVYETNLVLIGGIGYTRMDSLIATMRELGWPWRAAAVLKLLPLRLRDWLYTRIATNRYALFGRRENCAIASPALRSRLIDQAMIPKR